MALTTSVPATPLRPAPPSSLPSHRHLLQIMALLLPMRRVCSGGNLRLRDLTVSDPLFGEGAGLRRRREAAHGGLAPIDHSLVAPDEE